MPEHRTITEWHPNDQRFWEQTGKGIARRNLFWSILAEFLGFSVWQLWSAVAVNLNKVGFHLTLGELFWLVSIPGLVGATMRFPYGFVVARVGGRNWTVISAALLLIPSVLLAVLVQHPTTPYWALILAAATAGFGGGNFASSMANISYYYPDSKKGWALGLNAAGGNIGVAVVQFVVPAVIGLGVLGLAAKGAKHLSLQMAGLVWLPFIVVAMIGAFFFMNNLTVAKATIREQLVIVKRRQTWVMSWLYIGTFGSFIGYSAAFPLLIKSQFPHVNPLEFAFLGPLIGSLARPLGGRLSDRLGGASVTFVNFIVMMAAALGVIWTLSMKSSPAAFPLFLVLFLVLFVTTGIGNGSTFRMIPAVFRMAHLRRAAGGGARELALADRHARTEAAAALGFTSAIAAYGSFVIPQAYSASITGTGSAAAALFGFVLFYATCVGLTWWCFLRRSTDAAATTALAEVGV